MKKLTVLLASLLPLIIIAEAIMVFRYGFVPLEPEPPQFEYQYADIYKSFFKKIVKGSSCVYIPQRSMHNSRSFSAKKSPDTIRIFLVGGSVAHLFDSSSLGKMLRKLIKDKKFEIINCGMGAYDSYRDYLVEKEVLSYQPDLIILFSGNNEFYEKETVNLWAYYLNKFLRKSWIYRKAQDYYARRTGTDRQQYTKTKKERLLYFAKNIRLIVKAAKRKKVPIILCTLPVNVKDCPPSEQPPPDKQYILSRLFLEDGDYIKAIQGFKEFLKNNPNNHFGLYFLGRAYEGLKDYSTAKRCYVGSLEFGNNNRATAKMNETIRKIIFEEKVGLADLDAAFTNLAEYGLLGMNQFQDNCHWYRDYDAVVTNTIVRTIFMDKIINSSVFNLRKYDLDRFLTLPHFLTLQERGNFEYMVRTQMEITVTQAWQSKFELSELALSYFKTLYLMSPFSLHSVMSEKHMIKEILLDSCWTKAFISDFDAYWPSILFHVGETYRRLGLYKEAGIYFEEACLAKNYYLPYLGKALVYFKLGEKDKALENIEKAEMISESPEIKYYKEIFGG